ncbi:MAG TPA: hypothetical protein VFV95_14880 [Vicinamibacterales bacterium]|nr:hypothetical protein [Vicinamibacterales bacterium]
MGQTNLTAVDPARGGAETAAATRAPSVPPQPCCHGAVASDEVALGSAIQQAMGFTVFQHVARLTAERTRHELGGPFIRDWFTSVSHTGFDWDDGGKVFTNYVAHPVGGAVYANIYRQNDHQRSRLTVGQPGYGAMLVRAFAFSAALSAQFELGPLSEASIGNVGLHDPRKMAWVDLVVTPTLGTAWMVGEDLLDQRVLARLDSKNVVLRNAMRTVLNLSRSGANLSRGKLPWYRDRDISR